MVEDLVSTGGSVLDVVKVLRAAGAEVLGVVSIFTYGMKKGLERLAAANVKNVSLTKDVYKRQARRGVDADRCQHFQHVQPVRPHQPAPFVGIRIIRDHIPEIIQQYPGERFPDRKL